MSIPIDNSTLSLGNWCVTTESEQLWNIWNATGGLNLPVYTEAQFSNYNNSATPPQPGLITLINGSTTVATIVITFDGNNNISNILRTS
jgi:hypothetical protein